MGDHAITLLDDSKPEASRAAPSFDQLFNAHHEKVMLAAYRVTGNLQDAEDVLQSVFLRLLNRREPLDGANNPAGYLCRAAINGSLDLLRSRARKQTEELDEERHASEQGAADSEVRRAELQDHLRRALLSLDQRASEVFALRVFEGFSNTDIATLLDISSNSVAVTLHKARARLQELLRALEGEDR